MLIQTLIAISEKKEGKVIKTNDFLNIEYDDSLPNDGDEFVKFEVGEKIFFLEKKDLLTLGHLILSTLLNHEGLDSGEMF